MNTIYQIIAKNAAKSSFSINIRELDNIGKNQFHYQKDLSNPTYADKEYVKRKSEIIQRSKYFKIENPNQDIQYLQTEHMIWKKLFSQVSLYHPHVMSKFYIKQIKKLGLQLNIQQRIPKMTQLSEYLQSKTGFQIIPAPGIVSQRDFLNALAFKVFMASQFIRHPQTLYHAPQPDVFHEYVGHIPTLANKDIANISHQLGLLSLGATDEQLKMLGNTYLFIIQFGLCRQGEKIKSYGAAISACLADLKKIYQSKFTYKIYEPEKDWKRSFDYSSEQSDFLLVQQFEDVIKKIKGFSNTIKSGYDCQYDERTKNVIVKRKIELDQFKLICQ